MLSCYDPRTVTVASQENYDLENMNVSLAKSNILPAFVLLTTSDRDLIPAINTTKNATFLGRFQLIQLHGEKLGIQRVTTFKTYPFVLSDTLSNTAPYAHLIERFTKLKVPLRFLICLEVPLNESLDIFGDHQSINMQLLDVIVAPCTLSNTSECASQADLPRVQLGFAYEKSFLRVTDSSQNGIGSNPFTVGPMFLNPT